MTKKSLIQVNDDFRRRQRGDGIKEGNLGFNRTRNALFLEKDMNSTSQSIKMK